jgi:NAD(P)H-dependent FMN reductase
VRQYQSHHTQEWATTITQFDGFITVTPEYNHSTSSALRDAVDYPYAEYGRLGTSYLFAAAHEPGDAPATP